MAAQRLASAGVASPRSDAEELAAFVLGVRRSALPLADWEGDQQVAYGTLVHLRSTRVPLQHILGTAGFRYLEIAVGTGVFTPRPETEVVAQAALDGVRELPEPLCVDLCSGSGAIALALATEHPGAVVHAVERSPEAYAWLTRNIDALAPGVTPHLADAATALAELDGTCDLVVSNPPYVEHDAKLEPEVTDHDPAEALWGGGDGGLDVVRVVVATARRLLRPGAVLVVEHSDRQGASAAAVARAAGFSGVVGHQDLTGRDRFFTARAPQPKRGLLDKLARRSAS